MEELLITTRFILTFVSTITAVVGALSDTPNIYPIVSLLSMSLALTLRSIATYIVDEVVSIVYTLALSLIISIVGSIMVGEALSLFPIFDPTPLNTIVTSLEAAYIILNLVLLASDLIELLRTVNSPIF
ncbi:hypothetical protein Tneu_1117 [Pyrobaculum neutrophilum V24Sta]|uniref:Uncharacterized protein n=1 Tax=Pyrobaculum neutrophilum (strain DSM 2338 / JCM 9278 / NBRC 100436 / V24Sta) TaxID=444157 RepID=B1YE35_PYRNV|nr:hypothetical protein Tneu_1117 [Pyrobaculum neutrophilum V24Sta]